MIYQHDRSNAFIIEQKQKQKCMYKYKNVSPLDGAMPSSCTVLEPIMYRGGFSVVRLRIEKVNFDSWGLHTALGTE